MYKLQMCLKSLLVMLYKAFCLGCICAMKNGNEKSSEEVPTSTIDPVMSCLCGRLPYILEAPNKLPEIF